MLTSAAGSYTANSADGAAGQFVTGLYASIAGKGASEIDQQGYNYWLSQVKAVGTEQAQTDFASSVKSIRGFAGGGMFGGGLRIVGEHEPELEATGPSRIYNGQQMRSLLQSGGADNSEVVVELRAMRKELAELKALQAENNADTKQHAQQFDAVSAGGNALVTMAA